MRTLKYFSAISLLFFGAWSYASDNTVPEFFYQPEDAQNVVEAGLSYGDSTDSDLYQDVSTARLSFAHGLTHKFGMRVGLSYSIADDTNGGNGINNLNLDLIGHDKVGGLRLHYGVLGSVTLNKTGSQRFTPVHAFNPYVGVSVGGDFEYGARFMYRSVVTDGDVWGNFDYTASLFGELNSDSMKLGAALGYEQDSGADDNLLLNLYGLFEMSSFTLRPSLYYSYELEDTLEDAYGVELAARFKF